MNIRSVSVDILAVLTCLSGSWSCGGNGDPSLERRQAIGAGQIEGCKSDEDRNDPALVSRRVAVVCTQPDDQITFAREVPHLVWLDPSARSNSKLFVFMPGFTNRPDMYQLLGKEAARLGYHSIGLMYQNNARPMRSLGRGPAAPCGQDPGQDPALDCSESFLREIIEGQAVAILPADSLKNHVLVTIPNSIDNRLTKLLRYLDEKYPAEGWSSFLHHGEPKWSKIAVAGHSTGGELAAMIGKLRHVDRVVMFSASPDGADAWVSIDKTPAARHFGLVHERDPFTDLTFTVGSLASFRALQMERFGDPVLVESSAPPYGGTHILLTDLLPQTGSYDHPFAHGSTVRDSFTPLDIDGTPRLLDAWRYLIGREPEDEDR